LFIYYFPSQKFQKETIPVWPWPASAITEPPNQKELLQRIEAIRSDLVTEPTFI